MSHFTIVRTTGPIILPEYGTENDSGHNKANMKIMFQLK